MKKSLNIIILLFISFFLISCFISRQSRNKEGVIGMKSPSDSSDTTEYELIVMDPGFDYWFSSRSFMRNQYSNEYLRSANNIYAQEWNRRYSMGDRRINSYINYDPFTKYNFEFNYKLFMYFKYFEEVHRVKLAPY